MRLVYRIVLPYLALFLLVLGAVAATSAWLVARAIEGRRVEQAGDLARLLATRGFPLNDAAVGRLRQAYGAEILIWTPRGGVFTSLSGEDPAEAESIRARLPVPEEGTPASGRVTLRGEAYDAVGLAHPAGGDGPPLRVYLLRRAGDNEPLQAAVRVLQVAGIGLVLVVVIGLGIAHSLARPIADLARATRRHAEGDPAEPLPTLDAAAVELRDLAGAFRTMIEGLRRLQAERVRAEKLAVIGRVAAGVAHEIRNPLTSLRMNIQLLARAARTAGDRGTADLLVAEIDRLNASVEGLLALARPARPLRVPTDLRALAGEVLALTAPQAEARKVSVEPPADPAVTAPALWYRGDADALRGLLMNLVQNALAAMPGGGTLSVRVRAEGSGGTRAAVLEVADTGEGIPESLRDRIFEPFVTGRPGGTGLGLAIARKIAEDHGGSIGFETGAEGTIFRVRLPAGPEIQHQDTKNTKVTKTKNSL